MKRLILLAFAFFTPALAPGQIVTSGTISVAAGGALLDGDRPAYQQRLRQKKDGYGGIEEFTWSRTTDATLLRFDARIMPGNEDYRIAARWEKFDAFYVEANYKQFRTFYDGSGGRLLPRDIAFSYFDEELPLDRSYFSVEIGTLVPDRPQFRLRYDRTTRDGAKNSIRWGDSNLAGQPFAPRAFVPSYLVPDEERDIFTAEISRQTDETQWKVAGRYERAKVSNRHYARRRPLEPQDRYVTTHEGMTTDLFAGHGYYERIFNERLRWSVGGLITSIDTNLEGSKIYGANPDAEYSATFDRRQNGDVGYFGLSGGSNMKQYIGNLNVVYQPAKYWLIRPGLKYEHLRRDSGEGHFDTDFGGPGSAAVLRQIEAASRDSWNEFTEELELRYTRWSNWSLNARGQWSQGTGNLVEQSVLVMTQARAIDRETEYDRFAQRYSLNATWYMRPGLTFGAQYNYRLKINDYDHRRDSSVNMAPSFDRYPAFIIDNDLESHDANFRINWRPKSTLNFATRYAHQRTTLTATMIDLAEMQTGRRTRHVLTQTASWNPIPRLYLMGAVNLTYDQLAVAEHRLTFNSDNNYINASLGAGYAIGKVTDVHVDLNHYRADNYRDNPDVTFPLNAGQELQTGFLTWVRRHTEHLIYTVKYGYARSRDGMFGGLNDFDAHLVYGKVQYKF